MPENLPVLRAVHDRLLAVHGPQGWWPADGPLQTVLSSLLVQNTRWEHAQAALHRMLAAGWVDPARLATASPDDPGLVAAVRGCGFVRSRTRALVAAGGWLQRTGALAGGLDHLDDAALRAELLGCRGIGPETADALSLYVFRRPVFVADAYARRAFAELGLPAPRSYAALRAVGQPLLEASGLDVDAAGELHALLVAHGRRTARPGPGGYASPLAGVRVGTGWGAGTGVGHRDGMV